MTSASLSFEVKHYDISRAYFQETMERSITSDFRTRSTETRSICQKQSMCGTQDASHIWQLGGANCIGGINVFVSSEDECFKCGEQTQCRIVFQSKSRREWQCRVTLSVWMMLDSSASIFKSKDAVNDTGEHLDSKIQTYVLIQ